MEWNDREKIIIDQLQQHTEAVDTESLWAGIKPSLPVRRKNNVLPLLFCFLAGLGLGIGGYHIFGNNHKGIDSKAPLHWQIEKASLLKELQLCNESEKQPKKADILANNESRSIGTSQRNIAPSLATVHRVHKKSIPEIPDNTTSNTPSDSDQLLSGISSISSPKNTSENDIFEVSKLENKEVSYLKSDFPLLIQPIISEVNKPQKTKLMSYVLAGGGLTIIHDKIVSETIAQKTEHQPMVHYAMEYGLQKRWKKSWFLNVGLNYTGLTSHIRYNQIKTEDILLTDTTGYYISPDGITTSETGDVIVTKITQKSGKTYNYNHHLILHPTIEYDIPFTGSSSFSIRLGAMLPIVSWQKNSILNVNGEVQRLPSELRYFERPFLNGGLMYNKILHDKTLGFYLDFLMGSQNIQTGSYITVRNFFLPQTGMRILF